jgi:hypothetical protein
MVGVFDVRCFNLVGFQMRMMNDDEMKIMPLTIDDAFHVSSI